MRGQTARRRVRHFGLRYDYESYKLSPAEQFPQQFDWLRERCAELADEKPERLVQALVTRYPPGAGIGWHRDAPRFGPKVMGVSLLSGCRMRFDSGTGDARKVFDLELEPRSAYVIGGAARSDWRHSIPATAELRYSITFRTLREPVSERE
jgi:DNA oxidative demethylase